MSLVEVDEGDSDSELVVADSGSYRRMMSLPKVAKAHLEQIRRQRGLNSDTKAVASALETRVKTLDLSDDEVLFAAELWKALREQRDTCGKFRLLVEEASSPAGPGGSRVHRLIVPGLS